MAEPTGIRQQTTLRDFLNVVFKRKILILSIIAVVTVLVFYMNASKPIIYESASRILVRRGEQQDALSGNIRYLGWAEEVSSQIQVILSEKVFERAGEIFADSAAARGLPANWRFNPASVRADVVGESNAFVIRYVNFNPALCQIGCEAMTLAFQDYYREKKQPPELADFFANEIADVRDELAMWEEKRNEFLNREQFYGASETARVLMHKMESLESQLLKHDEEISAQSLRIENVAAYAGKSGAELENELAFSVSKGEIFESGIVTQIKFSLTNLKLRKKELESKYTDKHPDVMAVNEQIANLHRDLEIQVENARQAGDERMRELRARRAEVARELAAAKVEWDAIPNRDRQLTEIENRITRAESKLGMLLGRQAEVEITVASRSEWEVTVLAHAGPPFAKRTRDYVRMALGPMLALVVALGIAFFLESMDHSLKNMAEVEEYLGARVLATISEFRK